MRYTYQAAFVEEEGGYSVSFPDLEGVYTEGDTLDEAVDMAAEALEMAVLHFIDNGRELPTPCFSHEGSLTIAVSVDIDTKGALIPTKDAAEMLGVNPSRVRQMVGAGQLASKRQGRDNLVYLWSIKQRLDAPRKAGRPKKENAPLSKW